MVTSERAEKLFQFDGIGAVSVDGPGAVQQFFRDLEAELRTLSVREERTIGIGRLERIAADRARANEVSAIVAARDEDGIARMRAIDSEGSVLEDPFAARGSGAELAIGTLEAADRDVDLDSAESIVRDALEGVSERDTETGEKIDTWRLSDDR